MRQNDEDVLGLASDFKNEKNKNVTQILGLRKIHSKIKDKQHALVQNSDLTSD